MCGERITVNLRSLVGSGTGPDTIAPVRAAASSISFVAISNFPESYARNVMRILLAATIGS